MNMPNGWEYKPLSELGKQSRPAVKAGPFGSALKKEFYVKDGYKIYGQEQVISGDAFFGDYYIDDEKYNALKSCSVEPGDILMSLVGTVGRVLVIPENAKKGIINPRLLRISLDKKRIFTSFAKHFLEDEKTKNKLESWAQGGTMGVLNAEMLKALHIPIPPLHEQQKIAQILSTWDKAIEKLEALIAAKQRRKKALMQQLLTGKKRFAGFEESWKEVELGMLFKEVKKKVGSENIIPHSITAGTGFVSHEEKWGKDISGSQYENYTLLRKGQFSYNKGNSKKYACGCMYLLKHADEIAVPNVFISFERRKDNVCNEFYEQYFIADYCARELRRYITSGARSDGLLNLSKADFFSVKLPLPSFNEQQKIASVLSAADQEIQTNIKQLSALKEQKKGLMQQLLTGKRRVIMKTEI